MADISEAKYRGIELEDAGHAAAAVMLLEHVVRVTPEDAFAWLTLADGFLTVGQLTNCRDALRQALLFCPAKRKWIIHGRLANLAKRQGFFQEAEQWYARASLDQEVMVEQWLVVLRADNLIHLEEFSAAEQQIRTLLDSWCSLDEPDEVYNVLGRALLGQGRYDEAREAFACAIEYGGDDTEVPRRALDATECLEEARQVLLALEADDESDG